MKKTILIITALFLSQISLNGQTFSSFSFNNFYFMPTGNLSSTHQRGYGFEVVGRFYPINEKINIAWGTNYTWLQGSKKHLEFNEGSAFDIKYRSASFNSIFIGPQFTAKTGIHLLPALTFSFGSLYEDYDKSPFGLDIGFGALIPLTKGKSNLDIGGRFSFTNLFNESIPQAWRVGIDLEKLITAFRFHVGWNFDIH